jgi:hypothetical protein
MMKVIVAALDGICPKQAIQVMRDYLHIHMLSHYETHSEQSLEYLRDAIDVFFFNLRRPDGDFIRMDLITPEYEPQKMHYLRHYPESVRNKGSLPSYSTDRTEIWHKPLKSAYQRSNKKEEDAVRFILKEQAALSAFQGMIYDNTEKIDGDDGDGGDGGGTGTNGGNGHDDSDGEGAVTLDDFEDSVATQSSAFDSTTTFAWPKSFRTPIRRSSDTEKALGLTGFQENLRRFLHGQDISYEDPDPRVWEFNSIKMSYPACPEHEVAATIDPYPSSSAGKVNNEPVPQGTKKDFRINANTFSRHETVAVKFVPGPSKRSDKIHGMTHRRVVQVLLLFKCRLGGREHELAYVNWFETTRIANDTACGMYLVKRTTKRSVIRVTDIELPIHLMPKFGNVLGEAVKAKKAMDEAKEKDRIWRLSNNYCGTKTWNMTDFILDYYEEFWINVWADPHLYKRLY